MQLKITSNPAPVDLLGPGANRPSSYIVVGGDGNLVFKPVDDAVGGTPGALISWPVLAGDVLPIEARAIDTTNTALPLLVIYGR